MESKLQEKLNKEEDSDDLEKEFLEEEFTKEISSNKNKLNQINKELDNIQNKIKINNSKIEQLKKNLKLLKNEKGKQQTDLINLLAKKESLEEIYKNNIFTLNNKNEKINTNNTNNNNQLEISNITADDFKQIEINKYIDQVILMSEDILAKCGHKFNKNDIINDLKKVIKNSYEIFINNSSLKNIDFIIDNFISKISLYISNQSFGKFSETNINICLKYLLELNIINEKIAKMNKFLNKQYKDKKTNLKMEIKNLENKNEILLKAYKTKKNIFEEMKNNKNVDQLYLQNFNFNIKNINTNNLTENQNIKNNNIIETKVSDIYINNNILEQNKYQNIIKNSENNNKDNIKAKDKLIINNIEKKDNFETKSNSELKNSQNNRLITGKKINRKIYYHLENNNEKKDNYNNLDNNSFDKNINNISDNESDDSIINNILNSNNNETRIKNELNDSKEIKKKRIQELIEEIERSEKTKDKTKNENNKIYNKKDIKLNNIENRNKNNEPKIIEKKEKINFTQIDKDIKKMNQVIEIFSKKKIINNKLNNNKDYNKSKNKEDIINCDKKVLKNKKIIIKNNNIINNRSLDSIFNKNENNKKKEGKAVDIFNKSKSPTISLKNCFNLKNNNENIKKNKDSCKIYYNKKKKGVFNTSKLNNKINSNNIKDKKINSYVIKNLVNNIKHNFIQNNDNNNKNIENKDNNKEKNIDAKIDNEITEDIINNLLIPKNNKIANMNNDNLLEYLNQSNKNEKFKNKNLKKFITNNEIINNNINNNNEITLPISNQPISNRISKLNLNIFITQNKDNDDNRLLETNILSEPSMIRERNKENQSDYFNGSEFNSDNINNGISKEEIINSDDNIINEEKTELSNDNYRKIDLNKKIFEKRNKLIIDKKFFSSNNRNKKIKMINQGAKTNNELNNINKRNNLNSQYSLFYNTHEFSINSNYGENSSKNKNRGNKLLLKSLSISQNYNNKQNSKNKLKYIDLSYLNQFNNSLMKSTDNRNSYSLNNEKYFGRKKPSILINNIKTKSGQYKNIFTEINNSEHLYPNKNRKNQTIKLIKNKSGSFNQKLNTMDTNSNLQNQKNKLILINKNKDLYKNKNKKDKTDLKKLLENNLKNMMPKTKFHFNPKKIFAEGVMESFCYFKILDKDSPKLNPLDLCTINPESLGYSEGYISLDVILGHFRIIPKNIISKNFKSNNKNSFIIHNNSLSFAEYTLFNNGNNVFSFEIDKNEKKNCIRIDLKNINCVRIKKIMQDIIKIHKIFLKYNSHSGYEYEDSNGKIKKKVLSINKLLYMKEITEINLDQNDKIKAALCNFFAFTILFGDNKVNKVECIFINFDLFNIWYKCLEMIAENNNKSKNNLDSHRGLLHRKYNSNYYNIIK